MEIGYWLSSEEHAPNDLVRYARTAEEAGFSFAMISDHFHPWLGQQGQSPFVWAVIGGIAHVTSQLRIATGVTCPLIRTHPAIVAHAAATVAAMLPGRFSLGVGSGENLNEHVLGSRWPDAGERLEMLEESIELMRKLWAGKSVTVHGKHYTVSDARLYTLPLEPPAVLVAASGPRAAELAGRAGDGLIATSPEPKVVEAFEAVGGSRKPRYGQVKACWAAEEATARRTAFEVWPNAALPGALNAQLREPSEFEAAVQLVTEDKVAEEVVCGPDPARYVDAIQKYADAGFDHVSVHQIGPDQDGFFRFFQQEVMPKLR
jgi:G6PDH family F420-dependent oxidoreductase